MESGKKITLNANNAIWDLPNKKYALNFGDLTLINESQEGLSLCSQISPVDLRMRREKWG